MNGMGRQWKAAVNLLLILIVCLCGCGAKAKTEATPKGTDAYEAYEVEEIMFPAADAEIEKLLTEDQTYTAGEYLLHGGKVYRQAQVYSGEGDRKASYLQSLSAPYKSWDSTVIGSCQIEGKTYVADKLFFVKDVPTYCLLTSADGDGEKQYFAKYADGAVGEVVCAVPDSLDIGYGTELVFDCHGGKGA